MTHRRIFIAINLPENIKKEISNYQLKWLELPIRWVKKENLHITLSFLGYLTDEELLEVLKISEETALKHKSFIINLNRIIYGPPKQPPRMVWVEGEKSEELGKMQKDLESSLSGQGTHEESRAYAPHITLARINQWEFRKIEPEERPEINEEINLSFEVNSIDVMESRLKKGGPEYSILESCQLKD